MTKDEKFQKTGKLITEVAEPQVKKLIEILNKTLAKFGVRAGVELKWYYEEIRDEKALEASDDSSAGPFGPKR